MKLKKKIIVASVTKDKAVTAATTASVKKTKPVVVAPPAAAEPRNGVNIGKTSGLRVMAFQDLTLTRNDEPKYRLTDTELAALWRAEFPNSRAVQNGRIDESIVRGVRNLFNQGTGGHGTPGQTHQSKPYVMQDGKRVGSTYVRAKKVAAAAVVAPVVASASKPKVVKGKVVARRRAA